MNKFITVLLVCFCCLVGLSYAGNKPVKVACVGDSITAGYLVKKPECWASRVGAAMKEANMQFGNFGVTARCLLNKGDRPITKEKAYQNALAFKPDILFIGLGTNDSKDVNWAHKADFEKDYKAMIAAFKKDNPRLKVYCLLCIPSQEAKPGGINMRRIEQEINPLIRKVAKAAGAKLINMHKLFVNKEDKLLLPDKVHPTAEGHRLMADHVIRVLMGKEAE